MLATRYKIIHRCLATLEKGIHFLEEAYISSGPNQHIHRQEGEQKVRQYKNKLMELTAGRGFKWDNFTLLLSDEDSRYTTDAAPGMMMKQRMLGYFSGDQMEISVWDVYCSPGMDLLYFLVTQAMHPELQIKLTGVSICTNQVEQDRFAEMESNIQSLLHEVLPSQGSPPPMLIRSDALEFCKRGAMPVPDILWVSPPWMKSNGHMAGRHGELKSSSQLVDELRALNNAILQNGHLPHVISFMVPYKWEKINGVLQVTPEHRLAESWRIVKRNEGFTISTYYVFILVKDHRREAVFNEYVFHV